MSAISLDRIINGPFKGITTDSLPEEIQITIQRHLLDYEVYKEVRTIITNAGFECWKSVGLTEYWIRPLPRPLQNQNDEEIQ